ncbi:MAG: sulfurtransferase TusA family protein [Alphaproteobacteria bacterium]|jgi:tRNA 2-thiouridine synthesizing protein A|nr:sulfurtransferase TusA family protein [Alphaproteobacteria bacterium]MBU1561361.1 sulfurtransferase TusA family protein [Alphaproteobacteria bacterium]MBU2303905.1 sulfurtransferase TusA family protein [Alphaproteobacteria bacterium]MBU2366494.1 sulfurtransferase TusA family protein [Alphaproteobacteria bacterium]
MASTGSSSLATEPDLIDARGLKCPLPVLKMEKRLAAMPPGATLIVLATDPMAKIDIPLHCQQNGHTQTLTTDGDVMRFEIVKA